MIAAVRAFFCCHTVHSHGIHNDTGDVLQQIASTENEIIGLPQPGNGNKHPQVIELDKQQPKIAVLPPDEISRLKEERRKAAQLYDVFRYEHYEPPAGAWLVETRRCASGKLYTTFQYKDGTKVRSLKGVTMALRAMKTRCAVADTRECNLCQEQATSTLECGHTFCSPCLNNYFRLTPPEMILDQANLLPVCPVCKSEGICTFITSVTLEQLMQGGFLDRAVVKNLDKFATSCAVQEPVYDCIVPDCDERWTLSDLAVRPGTNRYEVRCPKCDRHQCSKCGVPYDRHEKLLCRASTDMDAETVSYLRMHTVPCPGACGQRLQKDDSESTHQCNVIRCMKDRLYVCALCGEKLNSTRFDAHDTAHVLANQHFATGPVSCRDHLFTSRSVWLSL